MRLLDRYPLLRKASVLLFVIGALAAYRIVEPYMPKDHEVAIRLADPAETIELEATILDSTPSADALAGFKYHFDKGTAPAVVRGHVRSPDGVYTVKLRMTTQAGPCESETQVRLGKETSTIRAECP